MTRPQVAIVYFSATGVTAHLAQGVQRGAEEAADVAMVRIVGADIVEGRYRNRETFAQLDAADAVIFGSPTFMGGPAAEFKAFADATSDRWSAQAWAGKLAGGFTSGGQPNGDQSATLGYFAILAAQHGMLWCGIKSAEGDTGLNRLGVAQGLAAQGTADAAPPEDMETAAHLGRRIAHFAGVTAAAR